MTQACHSIYPREMKSYVHTHSGAWMLILTLLVKAKEWKPPKCPSRDERKNKLWCFHTVEYYSAIKRNELLIHAATWMNFNIFMWSERN